MFARQDANVPFELWVTNIQIDLDDTIPIDLDTCDTFSYDYNAVMDCKLFSLHGCVKSMSAGDLEIK